MNKPFYCFFILSYLLSSSLTSLTTKKAIFPSALYQPHIGFGYGLYYRNNNIFDTEKAFSVDLSNSFQNDFQAKLSMYYPWVFISNRMSYRLDLQYENIGTMRYYGQGNNTTTASASNYHKEMLNALGEVELRFFFNTIIGVGLQLNKSTIKKGKESSSPTIQDKHPTLSGLSGEYYTARCYFGRYDSRDDHYLPKRGFYIFGRAEFADSFLDGRLNFQKYKLNTGFIFPIDYLDQWYLAMNLSAQKVFFRGILLSFYEYPSLGGDNTLRAYPLGRYYDEGYALTNTELRYRIHDYKGSLLLDSLELATFIDSGVMFNHTFKIEIDKIHFVYGLGVRLRIRPGYVIRLDSGTDLKETSAYLSVDYAY